VLANDPVAAAVAIVLVQNNKILLGKRIKNGTFEGWQCPGGYLLKGETLQGAARRICLQKTGLEIEGIRPGPFTNNLFPVTQPEKQPVKHTVTLYLLAQPRKQNKADGSADDLSGWSWFEAEQLPGALFLPLSLLREQCDLAQLIDS